MTMADKISGMVEKIDGGICAAVVTYTVKKGKKYSAKTTDHKTSSSKRYRNNQKIITIAMWNQDFSIQAKLLNELVKLKIST